MLLLPHRRSFCVFLSFFAILAASAAAAPVERPFAAPPGAVVTDSSYGDEYLLWRVSYPDGSASAVVGQIRLAKDYRSKKAFRNYIEQNVRSAQDTDTYGIRLKLTWRGKSYVFSGSSSQIRVYGKGRLDKKGFWHFGSVAGRRGLPSTASLAKMVRSLK